MRSRKRFLETIPQDLQIIRVRAFSTSWTRRIGLGNIALRALPFLYSAGSKVLRTRRIDLIYFSTTAFPAPVLGRIWQKKFGVPFIIDIQDLWVSDYYRQNPKSPRPPKSWFADRLHRSTEPWTMAGVSGIVAVSSDYIQSLQLRYPFLKARHSITLPFAASENDFSLAHSSPQRNVYFDNKDGLIHGVYVGRGGADMAPALRAIFRAFKIGLDLHPDLFSRIRLHFVGTDYAPRNKAKRSIEPSRANSNCKPTFMNCPFAFPISKLYSYYLTPIFYWCPDLTIPTILRPKFTRTFWHENVLAVFHENSSVCKVIRETHSGLLFELNGDPGRLSNLWHQLLCPKTPAKGTDWDAFSSYLVEMTRRQCELFNDVLAAT